MRNPSTWLSLLAALGLACTDGGNVEPDKADCTTWYADGDGDGYGNLAAPREVCDGSVPDGFVDNAEDCQDTSAAISPEGAEICDFAALDEDCNGLANDADEGLTDGVDTWPDLDEDGFGDPYGQTRKYCSPPPDRSLNAEDCDDTQAGAFPGAAYIEDIYACMQDADGDGWGSDAPGGSAVAGTDCDDADISSYPDAPELFGDGIDQDCNGADDFDLSDDFELGGPDGSVFASSSGDFGISDNTIDGFASSGQYSARIGVGGTLTTITVDMQLCENLSWSYRGRRGPNAPGTQDALRVQFFDGGAWVNTDVWWGTNTVDGFRTRGGRIEEPAAFNVDFALRLLGTGNGGDFYIDDFHLGCAGADGDGDGAGAGEDCDDADPLHWSDCNRCLDADLDGFGDGCNQGPDCDDGDATVHPGASDPSGDGRDADCSGGDGPGMSDDFESGGIGRGTWRLLDGEVYLDADWSASADHSLNFEGPATAEGQPLDMSACSAVAWRYAAQRGPLAPLLMEELILEWWDGSSWIQADAAVGLGGFSDPQFLFRTGVIADPAALSAGFVVRLRHDTTGPSRSVYIDDLSVNCADGDADGDGIDDAVDCADADPGQWFRCATCVDGDGDGFGEGCDLGRDCDDAAADVYPVAVDVVSDGIDTDCDGRDAPGLQDNFDAGVPAYGVWETVTGSFQFDQPSVGGGDLALALSAVQGGTLSSSPIDTTACDVIRWSYEAQREPQTGVVAEWWDGASWIEVDRFDPDGTADADFERRTGEISDLGALGSGFRIRFRDQAQGGNDRVLIDDVSLVCGLGDDDGDGFDAILDCDDTDPNHWFDCGVCVDLDGDDLGFGCDLGGDCDDSSALHWGDCGLCTDVDGDGYGLGCDLGNDCDDGQALAFPGGIDATLDGLDQDCSGVDGVGLFDDFELGEPSQGVWRSMTGDVEYVGEPTTSGIRALAFSLDGIARTISMDTSACSHVAYSWQVKRGPEVPQLSDGLFLRWWDGAAWNEADRVEGAGRVDNDYIFRTGTITDPAALHGDLSFSVEVVAQDTDDFYVDDLFLTCGIGDADGDGVDDVFDCDPADAAHAMDCGVCVDVDGDGYGAGCDLGPDCNDAAAQINPGMIDPLGGPDADCSGVDGPGLFDDFEDGEIAPGVWTSIDGQHAYSTILPYTGTTSLVLFGGARAEGVPMDLSTCSTVVWSYQGRRGPPSPEPEDALVLSWWDGLAWQLTDRFEGSKNTDNAYTLRTGTIADALATAPGFRIQLLVDGDPLDDAFLVDDLSVGCGDGDIDGDGFDGSLDCNDNDATHWADCGTCVDFDGDGYGSGCDLGTDCDDTDNGVFPGNGDAAGDGLDRDCSGVDGPGLVDDFDLGVVDSGKWIAFDGNIVYDPVNRWSGGYGLSLSGRASAEGWPMDVSACTSVAFGYQVMAGPDAPEVGDDLELLAWDGTAWTVVDTVLGDDLADTGFTYRSGVLPAMFPLNVDFQVGLRTAMGIDDTFVVDDLSVVCGLGDADLDGVDDAVDCDASDGDHVADCDRCVDGDGDGYGTACDLGADCDDGNAAIFPGGIDLSVNGVDSDCSGVDGPGLVDDFELGAPDPGIWAAQVGDVAYDATIASRGSTSLRIGGLGTVETVSFDASSCPQIAYRYDVKAGPDAPELDDQLQLLWWNGAQWVPAEGVSGRALVDAGFSTRSGIIDDALALAAGFKMMFGVAGTPNEDHFFIDELSILCGSTDGDGDGVDGSVDCDDADADHWSDCGVCVDSDADGFGVGCDLGLDCNDGNPQSFPGSVDVAGDGIDADCNGIDGVGIFDDFEDGSPAPGIWTSMIGDFSYDTFYVGAGTYSLRMGGGAEAESQPIDTSTCTDVAWRYDGLRGPDGHQGQDLSLAWWDGVAWVAADRLSATGIEDAAFRPRLGAIVDPLALSADFRIRLTSRTAPGADAFFLDDLTVVCGEGDLDLDGVDDAFDCDVSDPAHAFDCATCVDVDLDGYGFGCDYGPDCNDGDPTVFPGAPDASGDGVDADCATIDGIGLFDDFEAASVGDWWTLLGDAEVVDTFAHSGQRALVIGGGGGVAQTQRIDTSGCADLTWSVRVKRGPNPPEVGEDLQIRFFNGNTWIDHDAVLGDGIPEVFYTSYEGTFPFGALDQDFRLQLEGPLFGDASRQFHVDDVTITCL